MKNYEYKHSTTKKDDIILVKYNNNRCDEKFYKNLSNIVGDAIKEKNERPIILLFTNDIDFAILRKPL